MRSFSGVDTIAENVEPILGGVCATVGAAERSLLNRWRDVLSGHFDDVPQCDVQEVVFGNPTCQMSLTMSSFTSIKSSIIMSYYCVREV